jgi:hypothetical protein
MDNRRFPLAFLAACVHRAEGRLESIVASWNENNCKTGAFQYAAHLHAGRTADFAPIALGAEFGKLVSL